MRNVDTRVGRISRRARLVLGLTLATTLREAALLKPRFQHLSYSQGSRLSVSRSFQGIHAAGAGQVVQRVGAARSSEALPNSRWRCRPEREMQYAASVVRADWSPYGRLI